MNRWREVQYINQNHKDKKGNINEVEKKKTRVNKKTRRNRGKPQMPHEKRDNQTEEKNTKTRQTTNCWE
jgi:hypothetical protein